MIRLRYFLTGLCVLGVLSSGAIAQEREREKEKEKEQDKKTVVVKTGKIKTFEKRDPAFVVVTTDSGEINAELAPTTFIEQQKLVFNPNEEVTFRGYETTRDGRTTFVVTEWTTKDKRTIKFRNADFTPVWTSTTTTTTTTTQRQGGEKIVVYKGKVKTFEKRDPAMVVIHTENNVDLNAELAPVTFLEEQRLMFAPDDMITVRGYETSSDGRTRFVVTEVTTKDNRTVKFRGDDMSPVWVKANGKANGHANGHKKIVDLSGSVTVVETNDTPDGRLVTIKADDGERVIALGPGTYLEKNRYELRAGDTINVRGWEVDREGKRVFLATEVKKGDATWKFRRDDGTVIWEKIEKE